MTVTINREYTERFEKKLEAFNRKYGKYATPVKVLSIEEHAETSHEYGTQFFLDIELDVPTAKFGKSNVTYLGVIVMEDDIPMVHTEQEGYDLNSLYKPNYCDHCHTTRRRNKYFFFLENGEVKQIGSSCVVEYFGADIGSLFLSFNKFISDIEEDNEKRIGFSGTYYMAFDEIVSATFKVTNGFTEWYKKSEYATDSASIVKNYLAQGDAKGYLRTDDYEMSDEEKEEFRQYVADSFGNRLSDYCNNVRSSLLMGDDKLRMAIPFRFVGIVASVIFGFEKARKLASEPVDDIPTDVKEGENVEFTALVSFIKSGFNRFGRNWYMYKVVNTPYKFFLNEDIEEGRYELKGVVKEVSSYNGKPSITLNNVNCRKRA